MKRAWIFLFALAVSAIAQDGPTLEQLRGHPEDWPLKVTLLVTTEIPVYEGAKQIGKITIQAGSAAQLDTIGKDGLLHLKFNGQWFSMAADQTDFFKQAAEQKEKNAKAKQADRNRARRPAPIDAQLYITQVVDTGVMCKNGFGEQSGRPVEFPERFFVRCNSRNLVNDSAVKMRIYQSKVFRYETVMGAPASIPGYTAFADDFDEGK